MKHSAAPVPKEHHARAPRQRGGAARSLAHLLKRHLRADGSVATHVPEPEAPPAAPEPRVNLRYDYPERKLLEKKSINLTSNPSLLSAEDVYKQTGLDLGSLKTVISLPQPQAWTIEDHKEMRLYGFEQQAPTGEHGRTEPSYVFLTIEQLTDMCTAARTQDAALWERATSGAITLDASNPSQKIGRASWLPGVGTDMNQLDDPQVGGRYDTISREQAILSMDRTGGLHVEDLGSKNGTNVYYGLKPISYEALHAPTGQQPLVNV